MMAVTWILMQAARGFVPTTGPPKRQTMHERISVDYRHNRLTSYRQIQPHTVQNYESRSRHALLLKTRLLPRSPSLALLFASAATDGDMTPCAHDGGVAGSPARQRESQSCSSGGLSEGSLTKTVPRGRIRSHR